MAWLIFASFCFATLQEGAKAHCRIKYSANEFAKARNHINETVNVFTLLFCNCVVEELLSNIA
ncbi:hypothetical protein [Campylobacter troglodytis]|uniref:hypothetical protein n=1 Tax=Campylobacter troglodytis TaxID=654363 RepID=UPI001FEC9CB4|nr:hypothetical protein [Campylobacter troglodytis]